MSSSRSTGTRALAFLDLYTSADLSGISMWNMWKSLLRGLAAAGTPHHSELVIPRSTANWYWPADFFDEPWITTHPVQESGVYDTLPSFDPETLVSLYPRRGKVVFDYVLNQRYLHTAEIANQFFISPNRWYQQVETPIFTWFTETAADDRMPQLASRSGIALSIASSLVGPVIVLNQYDMDFLIDLYDSVLSEKMAAEAMSRLHVVQATAEFDLIDRQFKQYEAQRESRFAEEGRLTIFHGGSLESKRRLVPAAKVFGGMRSTGTPIDILYVTQHKPKSNPFAEWGVQIRTDVQQAEYIQSLGQGDILWMGAEYEGTGLAYMEAIRSGMIPVALDEPWIRDRLPDSYPFIVDSLKGLDAAVTLIVDHWQQVKDEWQPKLIAHLDNWTPLRTAKAFDDLIQSYVGPARQRSIATLRKEAPAFNLLSEAVEANDWDEIDDFADVYKAMREQSDNDFDCRYVKPIALRLMLIDHGYRDAVGRQMRMVKDV